MFRARFGFLNITISFLKVKRDFRLISEMFWPIICNMTETSEFSRDKYIGEELERSVAKVGGKKVPLPEVMGGHYENYRDLVVSLVANIETDWIKRPDEKRAIEQRALESGLSKRIW